MDGCDETEGEMVRKKSNKATGSGIASRGKTMVLETTTRRRMSPEQEAALYIRLQADQPCFQLKFINEKVGHGVFATKSITKGSFLLEYCGELLSDKEAEKRLALYDEKERDSNYPRFYLYFFKHQEVNMAIDATKVDGRLGRMVNDSMVGNCKMKKIILDNKPHLVLYAMKDIKENEELQYDYGDDQAWWRVQDVATVDSKQEMIEKMDRNEEEKDAESESEPLPSDVNEKKEDDATGIEMQVTVPSNIKVDGLLLNNSVPQVPLENKVEDTAEEAQMEEETERETDEPQKVTGDTQRVDYSSFLKELLDRIMPSSGAEEPQAQTGNVVDTQDAEDSHTERPSGSQEVSKPEDVPAVQLPINQGHPGQLSDSGGNVIQEDMPVDLPSCSTDMQVELPSCSTDTKEPQAQTGHVVTIQDASKGDNAVTAGLDISYGLRNVNNRTARSYKDYFSDDEVLAEDSSDNFEPSSEEAVIESSDDETVADKSSKKLSSANAEHSELTTNADNATSVSNDRSEDEMSDVITPSQSVPTVMAYCKQKRHACLYCSKILPNIARHYERMHANERAVAQVLSFPKSSKNRRKAWEKVVNEGDYEHNFRTLEAKTGTVIVKYQSKKKTAVNIEKDFVVCEHCKGLYKTRDLWKHQRECQPSSSKMRKEGIVNGRLLMPVTTNSKQLERLFAAMKDDDVGKVIRTDPRLIDFAKRLLQKHNKPHMTTYVSQRLRELGRLLVDLRKNSNIKTLDECFHNANYDEVVESVRRVAGFSEGKYNIPSLALKIGHGLKSCAKYFRVEAMKIADDQKVNIAERFLNLYESDWNESISGKALETLDNQKYNKQQFLPIVEDVVTLNKHIQDQLREVQDLTDPEIKYKLLCKLTLAQVIIFNRKRSGEAERMTVTNYKEAFKNRNSQPDQVVLSTLSTFEQRLCTTHFRVELRGKRGRKVAVILTNEMKTNIEELLILRAKLNIENDHLFSRLNSRHPYRGCDCLREFASTSGAKHPELISSTRLRKQLATLAQVLNLSETNQDVLACFQGHDIRVHREYYKLPQSTLEVAKMSRLLHCLNNGTINEYRGKDINEIDFSNDLELESDSGDEASEDPMVPAKRIQSSLKSRHQENQELDSDSEDGTSGKKPTMKKPTKKKHAKKKPTKKSTKFSQEHDENQECGLLSTDDESEESEIETPKKPMKRRKSSLQSRHHERRSQYSDAIKEALKKEMAPFIAQLKVPRQLPCEKAMGRNPVLQPLGWKKIKWMTNSLIQKEKKERKKNLTKRETFKM